jgi:hypothetical protein
MAIIFATTRFLFFAMLVVGFIFSTSMKVSPSVGGGTPPTVVTKLYVKLARHQRITKSPTSRATTKSLPKGKTKFPQSPYPRAHFILDNLRSTPSITISYTGKITLPSPLIAPQITHKDFTVHSNTYSDPKNFISNKIRQEYTEILRKCAYRR